MAFDPTKELDDSEAIQLIREIASFGSVEYGDHLTRRVRQRNFSLRDILYIFNNGRVTEKEYNKKRKNWKYKIVGKDLDGDKGVVITAIISDRRIYVVTVM